MLLQRQHHAVGDDGKQHRVLEGRPLDDKLCIPEIHNSRVLIAINIHYCKHIPTYVRSKTSQMTTG